MEKYLFIINPTAGGGKANQASYMIEEKLRDLHFPYKIVYTTRAKEAIKLAEESIDYGTLVAVGGDGTVNEVAKGLINRGSGRLGIIPAGTGNDMAKALGLSSDLDDCLKTIFEGNEREIDLGLANDEYFLNIGSIGFDAEVVTNNIRIKKVIKSGLSYALSVIYTLLSFKKKKVEISIDGIKREDRIVLLAAGNGNYYGGGMMILPRAKLDNGLLSVCIVKLASNFTLLVLFPSIFKGNHTKYEKYVDMVDGKEVIVRSKEKLCLNIDGEVYQNIYEVKFKISDKKLKVLSR